MADWKRQKHKWPKRGATERRVHARVRVAFPITLDRSEQAGDDGTPSFEAMATDLGLGGVRIKTDRYLELFSRLTLAMELPVTSRDGHTEMHGITTAATIVRIEPDEERDEGTLYEASLSFTRPTAEIERVLATFMLQSLLFDPSAELV